MILIGYWSDNTSEWASTRDRLSKYPDPSKLVSEKFWKANYILKSKVIAHLTAGIPCNQYRGSSQCRICGCQLGSRERTDGVFIWPDKLDHYVSEHNVILPDQFLRHIAAINQWITEPIDESLWLEFAKEVNTNE